MRLRPYDPAKDFACIRRWINEERIHYLWCAGRTPYPLEEESFRRLLFQEGEGSPFAAETEEGEMIGFFVYSWLSEEQSGFLKYILLDPALRGHGYGTRMMKLALQYAFEESRAASVSLNVFDVNEGARKCYRKAGFIEKHIDRKVFPYKDELWGRCRMSARAEDPFLTEKNEKRQN
ncbi:MAG TPA: GNAT family N-acetyltransferase [Candidatus Choladousia intestinigallinarum]|nr:GNAT family N-acetyltransferase [Candidatus Choladousia intestinigallinarum]